MSLIGGFPVIHTQTYRSPAQTQLPVTVQIPPLVSNQESAIVASTPQILSFPTSISPNSSSFILFPSTLHPPPQFTMVSSFTPSIAQYQHTLTPIPPIPIRQPPPFQQHHHLQFQPSPSNPSIHNQLTTLNRPLPVLPPLSPRAPSPAPTPSPLALPPPPPVPPSAVLLRPLPPAVLAPRCAAVLRLTTRRLSAMFALAPPALLVPVVRRVLC